MGIADHPRLRSSEYSRRHRRSFSSKIQLAATLALAIGPVLATDALATSCVVSPQEGSLPTHMSEAARRYQSHIPENRGGLVERAQKVYENRRDIAAGILTEEEAQSQGGAALTGTGSVIVLPALFANSGVEPWNPVSLDLQLFVYSQTGSLNDYYREISYGAFGIDGAVNDWVTLPGNDTVYEGSDNGDSGGSGVFLFETIVANDSFTDFSLFDNDGPDGIPNSGDDDGYVDQVFVLHPEMGGECGGGAGNNLWSHQYYFDAWWGFVYETDDPSANGGKVKINRYALVPGQSCNGGMTEIGVFAHEFGHAIGIPDLYDTNENISGDSEGIGWWGLMGAGNWNSPASPAHMCAYSKYRLGWLDYVLVDNNLEQLCLPPVEERGTAAQVWSYGMPTNEYFLVENRQAIGFDAMVPAEGFVIYHIDEDVYNAGLSNNQPNADETHKAIDVECADANTWQHVVDADDLDSENNRGDAGDVWCATGTQNKFNALTTPSTHSYSGVPTPIAINDITDCAGGGAGIPQDWICAEFNVGFSNPVDVCMEDCPNDNCNEVATCDDWWGSPDIWIDNDEDGSHDLPAAGIENKLWTRVHNLGPDIAVATTVQVYLAKGAMGLEWPADADAYIGVTGFPVIDVGDSEESYIVFQYPDLFDLIGHYCIGTIIQQVEDPTNAVSAPLSNNIAQVNSQVLIARAGGAPSPHQDDWTGDLDSDGEQAASSCPGPFNKDTKVYLYDGYNPSGAAIDASIRIGSHPNYNDAVIPSGWNMDILPTMGPFSLNPSEIDSVIVRFSADLASHGEKAYVPLTLWDNRVGRVLGGTTITCIVDCFYPRPPAGGTAEWTDPQGDHPIGPTVLVEWDPVTLDTADNSEIVMLYEVYRSDDTPSPEVLVDKVAIDADPSTAKFQWFDYVSRAGCPITYTYRIRAVDAAGGAGDYSPPITLECETTSADELTASVSGRMLEIFPNPFGPSASTTVRFTLAESGSVDLAVYGAGGQLVRSLLAESRPAGMHDVTWNGRDDAGRELPSGVYYCRIGVAGHRESQEVVLIR